jgi:hypothetical protein
VVRPLPGGCPVPLYGSFAGQVHLIPECNMFVSGITLKEGS